jgi:hypothetical protein
MSADRWETRYQELLAQIAVEVPGFRLVKKSDDGLQRLIHHTLFVLTFGAQRTYLTHFTTTIGRSVYVADDWESWSAARRWATMRHERVHLQQFARYGLVFMAFLYIFVPLPAGLAWFRAHFEKEAYAESIRAAYEIGGLEAVAELRAHVVRQFVGGNYGWMWPFRRAIERWYDGVTASLLAN